MTTIETPVELVTSVADLRFPPKIDAHLQALMDRNTEGRLSEAEREELEALIGMPMEFEHLIPLASGGRTVEENLWLSCRRCNEFKGMQTKAADPERRGRIERFATSVFEVCERVSIFISCDSSELLILAHYRIRAA